MSGVLRLILSPRWIMWHLLTIGAMVTCGLLAAWQWGKAGSAMGSALNVGYGLQWPLFAVFFGVMWFRLLRMELRARSGEQPEVHTAPAYEQHESLHRPTQPMAPEVASPFGSGPAARRPGPAPAGEDIDPDLAAYNRMLALLAERDRAS